jgi:hypothetical protein
MKIFKIGKYTIEQFDDRNWVIKKERIINPDKRTKTPTDGLQKANMGTYGYYQTLQHAKEELAELVGKEVGSFEDLEKWINKIKEIK